MRALVLTLVALAALAGCSEHDTKPAGPSACASESSVNCTWDASTQGNHQGRSFQVTETPEHTCYHYLGDPAFAELHDNCFAPGQAPAHPDFDAYDD